jgi:hypothetical protein
MVAVGVGYWLNCKVGLRKGNRWLGRVPVLCNEIAGIAGEGYIFNFALSTFSEVDHFVDVNEMIGTFLTGILTCCFCLIYYF